MKYDFVFVFVAQPVFVFMPPNIGVTHCAVTCLTNLIETLPD